MNECGSYRTATCLFCEVIDACHTNSFRCGRAIQAETHVKTSFLPLCSYSLFDCKEHRQRQAKRRLTNSLQYKTALTTCGAWWLMVELIPVDRSVVGSNPL